MEHPPPVGDLAWRHLEFERTLDCLCHVRNVHRARIGSPIVVDDRTKPQANCLERERVGCFANDRFRDERDQVVKLGSGPRSPVFGDRMVQRIPLEWPK
jgi:hypothetical protein